MATVTRSTRAQLESSTLLPFVTRVCLGNGSWKSGQQPQNVVHPTPELRQVKVQADQMTTQSGMRLMYPKYISLLYLAAIAQ
jgi:hypothetical protein